MSKRRLYILLWAGLLVIAAVLTAFTVSAAAETRTVWVRLATGQVVPIQVEVPPSGDLNDIQLPGTTTSQPTQTTPPPTQKTQPEGQQPKPETKGGTPQRRTGTRKKAKRRTRHAGGPKGPAQRKGHRKKKRRRKRTPLRNRDGSPTPRNPGFVDALPGPSSTRGVPNFVIRKFRVPPFLLPIYQAAGIQYGVRWEILASINEIETDYGRNLNVSTAGAVGWMQFIPSTWRRYGTDGNKDGRRDPYNPVDAIFAAARYLKAAGYEKDVRRSIFAYNHADWYVDSVMLRARLIAGVPADLIGSLTGLTEGRFPVYARARYADDLQEKDVRRRVKRGQNAANVVESKAGRRGIDIYSRIDAPVVATNDGVIKKIGRSKRLGRYVVLQDVYGNRYMYGQLGSVSKYHPVPKEDADAGSKRSVKAIRANGAGDPRPSRPASAGRQVSESEPHGAHGKKTHGKKAHGKKTRASKTRAPAPQASAPIKERLFAHPNNPQAREAGGLEQVLDAKARKKGDYETYSAFFSRPFGVNAKNVRLRRLKEGSHVIGGTILGHLGRTQRGKAAHLSFEIRPAGRGAPRIDPKPILDGWKLLESTAIYRASGRNALYGKGDAFSIGQVLLLPKTLLEKRVLSDPRVEIYPGGRQDIRSGQIDRRVLATMEYLAESGLKPTITSLKSGHSFLTTTGNVSEHSSGNAMDIGKVNGIPILGHQEPGGITEQSVRRLMRLQGTMRPHQLISLLDLGGPTFAMANHADHIHVGFRPLFGANKKLGKEAFEVLKPGQWSDLLDRLGKIENPVVPTKPSKFALPVHQRRRASGAHQGE